MDQQPDTHEIFEHSAILPEDIIAIDALTVTRPNPATVPHTARLQYIAPETFNPPRDTARMAREQELAHIEQCSDQVTNIELVENLSERILEVIGTGQTSVRTIMKVLFGVPIIDATTFAVVHAELKRLRGSGVIARDERHRYYLKQELAASEPETDATLTQQMRNAGIYGNGKRKSSSVNHRTGRSGVRRRR